MTAQPCRLMTNLPSEQFKDRTVLKSEDYVFGFEGRGASGFGPGDQI